MTRVVMVRCDGCGGHVAEASWSILTPLRNLPPGMLLPENGEDSFIDLCGTCAMRVSTALGTVFANIRAGRPTVFAQQEANE